MTKTPLKFKDKTITVWERRGFLGARVVIHEQKLDFDRKANTLILVLGRKAQADKLPPNTQELMDLMAQSYHNLSEAFNKRNNLAVVVDIDYVLDQLIK